MKKLIVLMISIGILTFGSAQEMGRFRTSFTGGGVVPQSGGGGGTWVFEPQLGIKDNMNIGIRLAGAYYAKELKEGEFTFDSKIAAITTWFATYNYYFSDGSTSLAPFIGLGAGLGVIAGPSFSIDNQKIDLKSQNIFGAVFRGGFELKKAIFYLEYDMLPATKYNSANDSSGNVSFDETVKINNSYFSVGAGFFLGGKAWGK